MAEGYDMQDLYGVCGSARLASLGQSNTIMIYRFFNLPLNDPVRKHYKA